MRHLLSIADLTRADVDRLMERADSFAEVSRRDIKKVPTLRGRTVVSLFYESSTRTSASFELAAKRLSADLVSIKAAGSSVDKGESLKDTIATLSAFEPEAIVIRSPHAGAAKHSLAISHLAVTREREVVVVDVEDHPGVLADLTRKIALAGVNLDLVYVATRNRVVFGAADLAALQAALDAAS